MSCTSAVVGNSDCAGTVELHAGPNSYIILGKLEAHGLQCDTTIFSQKSPGFPNAANSQMGKKSSIFIVHRFSSEQRLFFSK